MTPVPTAASALKSARRIVVKVGSSLVVEADSRGAALSWMASLAEDLAGLRAGGRQVILVSSGAVALGRGRLGLEKNARLDEKQAAAAVGQSLLMQAWDQALSPLGMTPAQILLTRDDTERRRRWLNARATIEALMKLGAVPVVNENDTVATEEIRYGDNDRLAARAAQLARADLLILLSDVDGLYTDDPRRNPSAGHLPLIEALTPEVLAMAGGANAEADVGTGGMATKLEAARIARSAGCATLIVSGLTHRPLAAVGTGARATLITAPASPMAAYKSWIAGSLEPAGSLTVDAGAAEALVAGRSLLASGVRGVEGRFDRGDCVRVTGEKGQALGVGLAAYAAEEMERIRGRHSGEIEAIVGYKGPGVAIHRDDLVLNR
ncbi:glutamate 5-kinase [Brevundimonas aurifodinae]|uniref:Glutamate 5-kinase n=2 Tax=Brevundimonas TaxID=41275 RepID=A0ABV1NMU1_9CAUL|nr:MAG: glutamate 5-kinase [Brevundimonas sp. 12-68-7]OYX34073.1 MAG: glutamate 5-kinase [Brevundimonas subvibrioides]